MHAIDQPVVVTGIGLATPIGCDINRFEHNLFNLNSGVRSLSRFNAGDLPTRIAAEVTELQPELRDIKITFAMHAAQHAVQMAFGTNGIPRNKPSGLSVGLGLELFHMPDLIHYQNHGLPPFENELERTTFLNTPSDMCVQMIQREFHINTPPVIHISACAAGTDAIGYAFHAIRRGQWQVALAGGTDSMINPMGFAGFCRIGAMSVQNQLPQQASRPFDQDRNGFVLGEGAGMLLLESAAHAHARKATVLAHIKGYGNSLDAYHASDPNPDGNGAVSAMQRALFDADLKPQDIDAISAHGTGTVKNDPAEAAAIRRLFGYGGPTPAIFATKSLIGHLISAAGAVETIAAILCLQRQKLHATANLQKIAAGCELNHVLHTGPYSLTHILKNSFGFGGQNASIILSRGPC